MPIRETFWNIPHWAEYAQYILGFLTILVFAYGTYRHVRIWRMGQPEKRSDQIGRRFRSVIVQALGQIRTVREPFPGIMHLAIFWGMIALALGTVVATADWDITHLIFDFQFLTGGIYVAYELILDILGLILIVGLVMAAYRRYITKPARLQNMPAARLGKEDTYVIVILTLIAVTGYLVEGLRIAVIQPDWAPWSPVGNAIASLLTAIGFETNQTLHLGIWIFHMLVAFVFIVSIPFTKLFHLVAAPINIFYRSLAPAGVLNIVPTGNGVGVNQWTDFTWKRILDFDACVRCGRCQDCCPAFSSGLSLSPRDLMIKLKLHVLDNNNGNSLHQNVVTSDELWACTTCRACVDICPVFTDQMGAIIDMRQHLILEGLLDAELQGALANLGRYGNSFGKSPRMRARWTRQIEPKIPDARKEAVEYLWFVGDYASFSPTLTDITQKTAEVLQLAGVDFGILFDSENNAGNDVRRVGEEGLFELLSEKNGDVLAKCDFKKIVTTDPHTYNTLKNEYSFGSDQHQILHYSELIDHLISSGHLNFKKRLDYTVTYHDPCYLGRYNEVYDAPRRIIQATGCQLLEMPRNRENALCCGAGGGRIWMEEGEVRERPSESRIREAVALGVVNTFVVSCPKDVTMYQDAVKTTANEDFIAVKDLIELVHEALAIESAEAEMTPQLQEVT